MSPRERSSRATGTLDYQRFMARVEDLVGSLGERVEAGFDRMDARLTRVEHDVAKGALDQASLGNRFDEIRADAGEMRDLVTKLRDEVEAAKGEPLEAAARGAASGAAAAASRSAFWSGWKGWTVGIAAVLAGLKAMIDGAPSVIAFLEGLIQLLKGKDGGA